MPDAFLVGPNPVTGGLTLLASTDRAFSGGPYPGQVDFLVTITFSGFSFASAPNVVASTGNPHWTVHPIWVNPGGAGFVINRKTESPGGQVFSAYFLFTGPLSAALAQEPRPALVLEQHTPEEFRRRAPANQG